MANASAPQPENEGKGDVAQSKGKGASSLPKLRYSAEALEEDTENGKAAGKRVEKGVKGNGKRAAGEGFEQAAQKKNRIEGIQVNNVQSVQDAVKAVEHNFGGAFSLNEPREKTVQNALLMGNDSSTNTGMMSAEYERSKSTPASFAGGAFDMYFMDLPFLRKALKPAQTENYAALYAEILQLQADSDSCGQLAIHIPSPTGGYGRLSSQMLGEPLDGEPYDIGITCIERRSELTFTVKEQNLFWPSDAIPKGEGIAASLVLNEEMCGIEDGSGVLKMSSTPVWKDDFGGVVYRGVLSFRARYSSLFKRKGHGSGMSRAFGLWLVPSEESEKLECDDLAQRKPSSWK
ncbi:hypothetical protein V5O48_008576 [Marasmius crinis-equi]|uniref:Uncharacterized protein n=1 Tax=Marasmius crinis-equi TaxID=585013 RepID=A0ABR3FDN7_9AGAR